MVIVASAGVSEHVIDYTDCSPTNPSLSPYGSCSQYFLNTNASQTFSTCSCAINFTLANDYEVFSSLVTLRFIVIPHNETINVGASISVLRPEQLLPEPPQVCHLSRRYAAYGKNHRPHKAEQCVRTFLRQ